MKIADFNREIVFGKNKPIISLMLETDNTKEIRILMKAGQVMKEHQTSFPIVVHLISGTIDFEVNNEMYKLEANAILSLDSNVPHSLVATSDSIVRLSLAKQDSVSRVELVTKG